MWKCAECGNELFFLKEEIIHRRINGENLRFHPKCWRLRVSTKERADPTIPDKSLRRVIKERK